MRGETDVSVELTVPGRMPQQSPATAVPSTTPHPTSPAGLPRTGVEVLALTTLAVLLVLLGAVLIHYGRLRTVPTRRST